MSELKPCPFCGWEFAEHAWNEFGEEYRVCDQCGATSGTVNSKWDWQSRPIEDALNTRIAELEDWAYNIFETNNGKDSPNDTQTQTIVYGKERER